jgi:NADH-quinone oxidoreductase subunit H
MTDILMSIFYIIVFPGFIFLGVFGLAVEFVDRKLYARFQNRKGPPWFQPAADIIKLVSKETIIPAAADKRMFKLLPVFALAAASTAFLYVPIWGSNPLFGFPGDLIVVLYLLTIPTLCFFLAGWYSTSLFSTIGAVRALTQLFAYEVPLFMALLAPALLSGSWSIAEVSAFYAAHPLLLLVNIPGFIVAMIAVQGKLERVPFDMPEAETEIVAGAFTEYSGRLLGIFRIVIDVELIVASSLIAAVFLPFFIAANPFIGFGLYLLKVLVIVLILAAFRSVMARIRIEQMVNFCWKYLTPLAIAKIAIDLILKGVLRP